MAELWRNWARDQRCAPECIERPASEEELARIAGGARRVKVAGAGHSFTDVACTDGVMLDLARMNRVLAVEGDLVTVEAGITIRELGRALADRGLALENQGDVDAQTIAGAISTATHGTGARFANLSSRVAGVRLVTGAGEALDLSEGDDLLAARVSLGALGAISAVTLRCVPAFTIHRIDEPRPLDETLARLDEHVESNDHFELFVFPYTRTALTLSSERTARELRTAPALDSERAGRELRSAPSLGSEHSAREPQRAGAPAAGARPTRAFAPACALARPARALAPAGARARTAGALARDVLLENAALELACRLGRRFPAAIPRVNRTLAGAMSRREHVDASHRVYANRRTVHFTEMEYALPREHTVAAVERVLALIERRRLPIGFPIEVRTTAPDDALLSTAHGRPTGYVAVHQYRGMEFEGYFRAVEAIMDEYDGRPHWGKRHYQTAAALRPRYPAWDRFAAVRERLDRGRKFENDYLRRVLGP